MNMVKLSLSTLYKTWIIDLDGTIFPHNNYLLDNEGIKEKPLKNVVKFINKIPKDDVIIILTARKEKYRSYTIKHLKRSKIRFNLLIMDLPSGERILINDMKPSGLKTAYAINVKRDAGLKDIKIFKLNK